MKGNSLKYHSVQQVEDSRLEALSKRIVVENMSRVSAAMKRSLNRFHILMQNACSTWISLELLSVKWLEEPFGRALVP